jgi:hypothetical protein
MGVSSSVTQRKKYGRQRNTRIEVAERKWNKERVQHTAIRREAMVKRDRSSRQ